MDGIERVLNDYLHIKRNEKFCIVSEMRRIGIAREFFNRAICKEKIILIVKNQSHEVEEIPKIVEDVMKRCDVGVMITKNIMIFSERRMHACKSGCRVACLDGTTKEMLEGNVVKEKLSEMKNRAKLILSLFKRSKKVKVVSENGTYVKFKVSKRPYYIETGDFSSRGCYGEVPPGEVAVIPSRRGANGLIIGDFSDFGMLKLRIRNGQVINFRNRIIKKIVEKYGKCSTLLAEFGIGINNYARISDKILECEKKLGTVHFGFGENHGIGGPVKCDLHFDVVITKPTIFIGEKKLIYKGKFVESD